MNSETFLRTLRAGLAGLSKQEVEEIVADYEAHFAEARASGRSESEVADALGDPARLARELRAETGLRRFEAHRSLANLGAAMLALAGLAAVDIFFLLPLLLVVVCIAVGLGIGLLALGVAGVHVIFNAVFAAHGASIPGVLVRMLVGFGLIACLAFGGSMLWLGLGTCMRLLGRYVRLHYRLLEPDRDKVRDPGNDVVAQAWSPSGKLAVASAVALIVALVLLGLGSSLGGLHRIGGAASLRNLGWRCGPSTPVNASPTSVTFPFESGDRLDIDLPASVSYQPGPKAEATVRGDSSVIGHVHIVNGRLGLDGDIDCAPATQLTVELTGPSITRWGANGSSDLALSGIDQQTLELRIRGSGHVVANGSVQRLVLNVAGSGAAQLQGLSARAAEIVVHGSGEVQVAAQDSADIAIAGSGRVRLHGHPATLHSKVSGSGRIESVL
ncbi:putative membrane protein [Variovorax sp. SRS16]|uniref:GIN domain-containing protein n=1 Tax=Variovorax sp. SRS16 TaxID=282217 RepID=UPI0013185815|nr:DUF1700 domain-containing protein [Variovorax sp. SRS16]VTU16370.1 putative membrane protein [Variovorax sp. SRS16]